MYSPEPSGSSEYGRDKAALIRLGSFFFWDMPAGSDGVTACATCHFHAGAGHRTQTLWSTQIIRPWYGIAGFEWDRPGRSGGFVPARAAELGREALDEPEFLLGDLQVRRG